MATNLDFFMKYPLGKKYFVILIDYLKKDKLLVYKLYVTKNKERNVKSKSASYAMYGFPWTFMISGQKVFFC